MLAKIILLAACVAALAYLLLSRRARPAAAPRPLRALPAGRRRMPLYLGVAAVLALAGALLSAFLLVTAMAGGSGGGYRGQADFLQPVAIVLLAIGVVCAIAALVSFFRQRG
ncbi:hypothetical protein FYA99_10640 [Bordetella parapertussis]|uniref:Membrane protein n=3 Tax=Bordetella TaxID=517 RepID=A0A0H3LUW8_BORBR|nr:MULTISPECIES: hypothetical protein [Bordetella]KAK64575.1 hypothetical protein AZ22_2260 [Bordetella bronchiseptica 980-2]AMG88580.1 hypothetical protein AL472_13005 [Bordetella bronchiseptica]AOB39191.1 hypothetical protein BBB43_10300 [Bordetella parapertussis]AUL43183.1 hypothetical protein BTL54_10390 [Bordetella parapertussis]AWP63299.1 hypothetical protein B7P06_11665 [Bordetella parapertussis]